MGRCEGLIEGVEKVQLRGRKESDFFEIGFFEDGTNIEQRLAQRGGTTGGGCFIFVATTKLVYSLQWTAILYFSSCRNRRELPPRCNQKRHNKMREKNGTFQFGKVTAGKCGSSGDADG